MKGTMSELELSLFRQRSQEALKHKARRGALFLDMKPRTDREGPGPACAGRVEAGVREVC